jgi:hypothetical protein
MAEANVLNPVVTAVHPDAAKAAEVVASNAAEKKTKKGPPKRAFFGDRDEKGNLKVKIEGKSVPEWNPKQFQPLRLKDFAHPADYMEWNADYLEAKVARLRKQAQEERVLGSSADRQKAKKLKSLHEKFATMQKELADAGFDVEALLKD